MAASRALAGFSGVDITLIERVEATVVRKEARRAEQNERLRAQAAKLAAAHAQGLSCPAVRDQGEQDGRYWFEMDYVAGESLAHGVISGRPIDWDAAIAQLLPLLAALRASAAGSVPPATVPPATIPPGAFAAKLDAIAVRCAGRAHLLPLQPQIEQLAADLQARDWSDLAETQCHGDLTLENLLLRPDGTLVLIDFDVPDQSSFALDIGKLYQDLAGHWFLRQRAIEAPDSPELLDARLGLARALPRFDAALAPLVPGGRARIHQLAAFHLMRTLPYATDAAVPRFVLARIAALLAVR
jgi:hypothetical protein